MNPAISNILRRGVIICCLGSLFLLHADASAAARRSRGSRRQLSEEEKMEYQANDMIRRAEEYLAQNLEERGLKLLQDVPRMFPKSKARFKAHLELGKFLASKRRFDEAIKQLNEVANSEVLDEQAEALYQIGICYYEMNQFSQAFVALRRVNNDYPWSVFANEAFYYIGLCHFKLGRWGKSVEALKMVGTSVPPKEKLASEQEGMYKAESGQRFFIRVFDKDLVVLKQEGGELTVQVNTKHGDTELVKLEQLDRTGEYYIGSIPSTPGIPQPNDRQLQIMAGDIVKVSYVDRNTAEGERDVPTLSEARMVSTATAGFTDGAYNEYVKGVYGDEDAFLRVRDLDLDTSNQPDKLKVKVYTEYKAEKKDDMESDGFLGSVSLEEEPEYIQRDEVMVELTETDSHSGKFVGTLVPKLLHEGDEVDKTDNTLHAEENDRIVMVYEDELHMEGFEPRTVESSAKIVTGEHGNVKVTYTIAKTVDHETRKNLIEAKLLLKLGQIFKDVGLENKASDKADQGLQRIEKVITMYLNDEPVDTQVAEEAFSVKWELLLVQDKLRAAIAVCNQLTKLFPTTNLVDKALFTIGMAKMEDQDWQEATNIFNSVIRLPKSDYKAEAQYRIAEVYEKQAIGKTRDGQPDRAMMARALSSYQKCADTYPSSPFAGDALDKIVDYYISARDYARAIELMERVFLEHPDATWLDKMLLKWGVAAYRLRNYQMAYDKFNQCILEYPSTKSADRAEVFIKAVAKKLGK